MAGVRIIRAALRDLQKLSHDDFSKAQIVLKRLSQNDLGDTKSLEGFTGLLRTRSGNLRVVWQRDRQDIIVIKVGDRRDVYRDSLESRKVYNSPHLNLVDRPSKTLDSEAIKVTNTPQYQWHFQGEERWYQFVYGGYRYSPILTSEQEKVYEYLLNNLTAYQNNHSTLLVQSAPGTGKTVCAALLASRLYQEGCEVVFIVPKKLVEDVKKYTEIKAQIDRAGFWLGTFYDWLYKNLGSAKIASPQQELEALRNAARRIPNNYKQKLGNIRMYDVLLYQAFVLDKTPNNQAKDTFLHADYERIELLKNIKVEWWESALDGHLCRFAAANTLLDKLPQHSTSRSQTVFIIDEAQDLLLAELTTLFHVSKFWRELGHKTTNLILGDLNQRIQPTGFHWDKLKLGREICLTYNYRNSQQILEFANQFLEIAKTYGGKRLPAPGAAELGVEVGEPVRLLEVPDRTAANEFLKKLFRQTSEPEKKRYLLRDLANAVKVISPQVRTGSENLIVLDVESVKGKEFDACIAFNLFAGTGKPSLAESFQWYTTLTRARSRLLIVATSEEIDRVGRQYFANCMAIAPATAIVWITEVSSDLEIGQIPDDIQKLLLKRCESGCLYWDTYAALDLAGVTGNNLYAWEKQAIARLQSHSIQHLESELAKSPYISLKCLLLRAMNCSWKAASLAKEIKETEPERYAAIIECTAKDLEAKNMPYEAARIRYLITETFPENYPLSEVGTKSGNLVSVLTKYILSKSFPESTNVNF